MAPIRLGKPITDLRTVTVGEAVKAATADELVVVAPDAKVNWMAVFGGRFGGDTDELLGILVGIRIGNAQSVIVDVFVIEELDEGSFVPTLRAGENVLVPRGCDPTGPRFVVDQLGPTIQGSLFLFSLRSKPPCCVSSLKRAAQ